MWLTRVSKGKGTGLKAKRWTKQVGPVDADQEAEWPQGHVPRALQGAEAEGKEARDMHPGEDGHDGPETRKGGFSKIGVQVYCGSLS
jgi:hypothetical protein